MRCTRDFIGGTFCTSFNTLEKAVYCTCTRFCLALLLVKYLVKIFRCHRFLVIWLALILRLLPDYPPNFRSFPCFFIILIVIYLEMHLPQLINLGDKIAGFHFSEEFREWVGHLLAGVADPHAVPEPLGDLRAVGGPGVPVVHEDDRAVVLHVPDHSAYCLVHRPRRLLWVPVLTW